MGAMILSGYCKEMETMARAMLGEIDETPDDCFASGNAQKAMQLGVGFAGAEAEVLRASFRIESAGHRDRLKQGGFSRAVLADEKRDLRMQFQFFQRTHRGERKRIAVERLDLITFQLHG